MKGWWLATMETISSLSNLKGRNGLITGAGGALGRVIAETLAELGADLILVDKPQVDLESIALELSQRWGVGVKKFYVDLEIQSQRVDLISKINTSEDSLSILINNAAFVGTTELTGWSVGFEKQSLDSWRSALEVNLISVFDICQGLFPILNKSLGSNIVNIASIYGTYAPDWRLYKGTQMGNPAAYAVSKAGLIQLTRWLSTTIAPKVRVNAVSPGGIFRNQAPEFVSRYESRTPLERMASEDDLRGAIAYLTSDLSKYVTGQVISVDGGWGIW